MKIGTDGVLLASWCSAGYRPTTILDIGAGTGVVALLLAQRFEAFIDAVEIEANAYEQTVENFEASKWADRLFCYHASVQEFAQEMAEENETYNLIISNPPFYKDNFKTLDKARNTARFTTTLSFEELISSTIKLLSDDGLFALIIPYKEEENFVKLANKNNLFLNRVCHVRGNKNSGVKRSLLEFSFCKKPIKKEVLTIEIKRNLYTPKYINLTKDFYLNM